MSAYTTETRPARFETSEGGTVHVHRIGLEAEFEYRAPNGACVATVRMSMDEALDLMGQLSEMTGRSF